MNNISQHIEVESLSEPEIRKIGSKGLKESQFEFCDSRVIEHRTTSSMGRQFFLCTHENEMTEFSSEVDAVLSQTKTCSSILKSKKGRASLGILSPMHSQDLPRCG